MVGVNKEEVVTRRVTFCHLLFAHIVTSGILAWIFQFSRFTPKWPRILFERQLFLTEFLDLGILTMRSVNSTDITENAPSRKKIFGDLSGDYDIWSCTRTLPNEYLRSIEGQELLRAQMRWNFWYPWQWCRGAFDMPDYLLKKLLTTSGCDLPLVRNCKKILPRSIRLRINFDLGATLEWRWFRRRTFCRSY